jgi:hypothetical protein
MSAPKSLIVLACCLIALGVGWLMDGLGFLPIVDWVWVSALAIAGLATLALGGVNKVTLTIGPFLLAAAAGSAMRQGKVVTAEIELPLLVLLLGILILANLVLPVPNPRWYQPASDRGQLPSSGA